MATTLPIAPRKIATTATAAATLSKGKHTPVDATSGALTMTLPTDAVAGVEVSVEKVDASANAVTVTGTMRGVASSSIPLTSQYEARTFLSEGSGSWRPVSDHRTAASLSATFVPQWKPSTAYTAGQYVLNPSGQIVSAKTAFTSGTTYSAANWNVVAGGSNTLVLAAADPIPAGTPAGTVILRTGVTDATLDPVTGKVYASQLPASSGSGTPVLHSAKKYKSSADSAPPSPATTAVDFGTTDYVSGTNVDATTANGFTAVAAGIYQPNGSIRFLGGSSTEHSVVVRVNGNVKASNTGVGAGTMSVAIPSIPLKLNAGDVVTVTVFVATATGVTISSTDPTYTVFSLTYLGAVS